MSEGMAAFFHAMRGTVSMQEGTEQIPSHGLGWLRRWCFKHRHTTAGK